MAVTATCTWRSHGIRPMVAGTIEGKPEVAARVAWSGVGIDLKTNAPSSQQLQTAIARILGTSGYKARANALGAKMRNSNAPVRAVKLLECLATTQRPVLAVREVA